MYTDFEYAGKRLSDFGYTICKFGGSSDLTDVEIGCDITFSTVKNNHSSIHYNTSSSYENVYTTSLEIMKNPCNKNQDEMYHINEEISMLTTWLNRREYHKFKPLTKEDDFYSVHYYGSFNVKEKTINDRVVGFVLSFTGNAPYGFGEHIINEIDMSCNDITVLSEVITTTDSAKVKPKNIKLFGKGKQRQYEGNQLFDISQVLSGNDAGGKLTNNGDGSLFVETITNSANGSNKNTLFKLAPKLQVGETYTLNANTTGTKKLIYLLGVNQTWDFGKSKTITQEMLDSSVFWYANGEETSATIKDIVICKGTEVKPYEPYVGGEPSPNMNYPQKVECLGESGSIGGKVLTSNFLILTDREVVTGNGSDLTPENPRYCNGNKLYVGISADNYYYNVNVASYKITDGTVIYTPNSVNGYGIGFDYPVKENQTYSIGYDAIKGEVKFNFLDKNGYYLQWGSGNKIDGGMSFTVPEGASYVIIIFVGLAKEEFVFENIRLNQGETLQPYEPYTEQPFTALTPNGLRGIPLGQTIPDAIKNSPIHMSGVYWDSVEQQYYIADTENENGKDVQRIGKERLLADRVRILDSLCNEESNFFWLSFSTNYLSFGVSEFLCDIVTYNARGVDGVNADNGALLNAVSNYMFYIRLRKDSGVATMEEFKEYLTNNEVYAYVILDEPIVTKSDAQYDVVMNYPNTTIVNDAGAYMEVTYLQNYDNEFVICGVSDEYKTLYPNISITCKQNGNLRIKNTVTGNVFEVLNCSEGETIYVNGEHKFIDSDNEIHKSTTLFNDFNYNYLDTKVTEDDFSGNLYETSIPCKIVIDYSPIRKVGL